MDFNINLFLEKFKKIIPPDDFLKTIFKDTVKKEINIDIQKSDIRVEHNTIYISASPAVKSELYIKKSLLLKRLRDALDKWHVTDIR